MTERFPGAVLSNLSDEDIARLESRLFCAGGPPTQIMPMAAALLHSKTARIESAHPKAQS